MVMRKEMGFLMMRKEMGFEFCFTFQCENLNYSHWVCYSHTHLDMLFTHSFGYTYYCLMAPPP